MAKIKVVYLIRNNTDMMNSLFNKIEIFSVLVTLLLEKIDENSVNPLRVSWKKNTNFCVFSSLDSGDSLLAYSRCNCSNIFAYRNLPK